MAENQERRAQRLTKEQRIKNFKIYYRNHAVDTARIVSGLFNRNVKCETVSNLIHKFEQLGSVSDALRSGAPRTTVTLPDHGIFFNNFFAVVTVSTVTQSHP
jgi:hypothetical protein